MVEEFAGSMRDRIRVTRPAEQRDALGASNPQTEVVGEFWAAAEAIGTGDLSTAEVRSAMQRWRFVLRKTDEILPGDLVNWSGRDMIIIRVSEDRRLLPRTILEAEEKR